MRLGVSDSSVAAWMYVTMEGGADTFIYIHTSYINAKFPVCMMAVM